MKRISRRRLAVAATVLISAGIVGISAYYLSGLAVDTAPNPQSNPATPAPPPITAAPAGSTTTAAPLKKPATDAVAFTKSVDLDDYIHLSQQKRLELVATRDREQAVAVLLELIDNGLLGINEQLREGKTGPSEHYTTLFTAIVVSNLTSPLTLEQLEHFLSRGAIIDGWNNAWRRIITMSELPLEVSWRMIE